MINVSLLADARIYMGASAEGTEVCCCCGQARAKTPFKKEVKSSFTDLQQLILFRSEYLCDSCIQLYNDSACRFKPIFVENEGFSRILDREEILPILKSPPDTYVISVPYSFKKHHWLYAGRSTKQISYIGTDDRTVVIDYTRYPVAQAITMIGEYIERGIPRQEIITGKYSTFTMEKVDVDELEAVISPLRHSGAVELFVKYTPAVKSKIKLKEEHQYMLTQTERSAVELLKSICMSSQFRVENGLQFWSGYFERRVNRYKNLPCSEFISRLSDSVNSDNGLYTKYLMDMTEQEMQDVMKEIRTKTHLLIAIVYSERNNKS